MYKGGSVNRQHRHARGLAAIAVGALVVASCSSGSESTPTSDDPASGTDAAPAPGTDEAPTPGTDAAPGTDATEPPPDGTEPSEPDTDTPASLTDFATLGPPTGETIVIGMVNTEGAPGLDFPELRTDTDLAVAYLNEHGGMGGRPIQLEHCTAAGSPESSQSCAQELTGKGVEMITLGLDLFPAYDTYEAAGIPVFGALPILPPDFTANALFLSGGNATTMAGMAGLAVEHFDAKTVGIISADNPGANSSLASLTASLDKAGLTYVSVKGGDNETDAGFQGLLREASKDNPDVMISLYADAGCIGAMRGRVALGITSPMITTPICASAEVTDVVGDDALGWFFVGAGGAVESAANDALAAIVEPSYGPEPALGIGALGIQQIMALARVANDISADGGEVTGPAIFETLKASVDLFGFPDDNPLTCGAAEKYPSVCSFELPAGEYVAGGTLATVPGFEAFNVVDYLP